MDMSGARSVPDRCWLEIRDPDGALLASVPAEDDGARIWAELPAFPAGTMGTEQICTETGGEIFREEASELAELPGREGTFRFVQYG